MDNILVYCELDGTRVVDVSLELLSEGRRLADKLGVPSLSHHVLLQGVNDFLTGEHHSGDGAADNAVQCDEDGEGNEGPETAGHGVDALFLIQLLDLCIELLGVTLVSSLQLLQSGLDAGCTHHALLALCHEGGHEQVDNQCEEQDGKAIAAGSLVDLDQRP